jgi:hypothetical protein
MDTTTDPPSEERALDVAFWLAKSAVSRLGQAEAKQRLQEMFPGLSSSRVEELYLRGTDLADACYDVGDQCRDKRMTDAQAIASLRQRFPGFSAEGYNQALSWGYFISR